MKLPTIFNPSRSLADKLTLWVTLPMLIIFVAITAFIYRSTAEGIYLETNARYQEVLAANNEHVNTTLKAAEVAISNSVPLIEENLNRPDHLYSVVERVVALNPDIVGSAIAFEPNYYKEKGAQFCPYAYRKGSSIELKQLGTADYEYHYMDWYQIPKLLGIPYWSEPYLDTDGGNIMMTTYSLPLHNSKGELYAIFTADIALEWLSHMMQETDSINRITISNLEDRDAETDEGLKQAYSFIIGRGGTYIAHPMPERVLNETFFSHCMETPDTLDDHIGREMIAGHQGYGHLDAKGQTSIFYGPIERTGWSMAIVVPDAEIVAAANKVGLTIIGLMLVGLIIVFVVCHKAIGYMTRPLTRFADSADEIAQGHFDTPLPAVTTHDEMRRLHDSFLAMQQSLNHQIEETARVTEQKGRIEGELHIARSIQMAMLPKTFPPYPERKDIAIYGQLTPAKEVGGDLYDFYIRDEKLFFCIGDVSGKGIPASLVMAVTRALFRTISARESQPSRIVGLLNDTIAEDNEANMFVTMFVGVLDLCTGHMDYCNAGHDAPLLISADGSDVGLLPVESNLPAGIMPGWKFKEQETVIFNGTTIFLYTDGLTEAEDANHAQFGDERLRTTAKAISAVGLRTPDSLIKQIATSVRNFVGDAEQSDDLTMMAIQLIQPDNDNPSSLQRTLTLPGDIETVPLLHSFIQGIADTTGMDDSLTMNINLAVEEAVVNVMNYAYPDTREGFVTIEATVEGDWLSMVIIDKGIPFDPLSTEAPDLTLSADERPIGGLGIYLVRQLMDTVSYERRDGKNMLTIRKRIHNLEDNNNQ